MIPSNLKPPFPGFGLGALGLCFILLSCGPPERPWDTIYPDGYAPVSFLNKTHELQILQISRIRSDLELDCEKIARSPLDALSLTHFEASERKEVFSGQEIPFGHYSGMASWSSYEADEKPCQIYWVESDHAPNIFVLWNTDELSDKEIYEDLRVSRQIPAAPQTIVLDADYSRVDPSELNEWQARPCGHSQYGTSYCSRQVLRQISTKPNGARYEWSTQYTSPLHFDATGLNDERPAPSPECALASTEDHRLYWDDDVPGIGTWVVHAIDEIDNHCQVLMLESEQGVQRTFQACLPARVFAPLNPELAHQIRLEFRVDEALHVIPNRRYRSLSIEVRHLDDENTLSGSGSITLVRGHAMPQRLGLNWEAIPREGCSIQEERCDNRAWPMSINLERGSEDFIINPGEFVELSAAVGRQFYLIEAFDRVLVEPNCHEADYLQSSGTSTGIYLEAATVLGFPSF